jgi:hypothetical protein
MQRWDNLIPGDYIVTEGPLGSQWMVQVPVGAVEVIAGQTSYADVINTYIPSYHDETAWGYLAGKAKTFDQVDDSLNNWGWTNGALEQRGTYVLDLYAGAGRNDINKGLLVGKVTIVFNGDGTADVTYDTSSSSNPQGVNYGLIETHLWVGDTMLPITKKGKVTNSPGQFPDDDWYVSSSDYSQTFHIEGLEGQNIYIAAHAVVRIYE